MSIGPDLDQIRDDRTALVMDQWPHVDCAWGCGNCNLLFAEPANARCPGCGSEAIFDVAAVLNSEPTTRREMIEAMRGMLDKLEEISE